MTPHLVDFVRLCDSAPGDYLKLRKLRKQVAALHATIVQDPATPPHLCALLNSAPVRALISGALSSPSAQKIMRQGLRALAAEVGGIISPAAVVLIPPPPAAHVPPPAAQQLPPIYPETPEAPAVVTAALMGWDVILEQLEYTLPASACTFDHPGRAALRSTVEHELRARYAEHLAQHIATAAQQTAETSPTEAV